MDSSTGQVNLRGLLGKAEQAQQLAKWVIKLNILPQFQLTEKLLYGGGEHREGENEGEEGEDDQ